MWSNRLEAAAVARQKKNSRFHNWNSISMHGDFVRKNRLWIIYGCGEERSEPINFFFHVFSSSGTTLVNLSSDLFRLKKQNVRKRNNDKSANGIRQPAQCYDGFLHSINITRSALTQLSNWIVKTPLKFVALRFRCNIFATDWIIIALESFHFSNKKKVIETELSNDWNELSKSRMNSWHCKCDCR